MKNNLREIEAVFTYNKPQLLLLLIMNNLFVNRCGYNKQQFLSLVIMNNLCVNRGSIYLYYTTILAIPYNKQSPQNRGSVYLQ